MKRPEKTQIKSPPDVPRTPRWASPRLLLFVPVFFYLWLWVRPERLYHAFGTVLPGAGVFSASASFLKHTLATPAGLVIYLSGLLSQGYYHSWLGALIVLLCAMMLTELCRRHLVHAGLPHPAFLTCLPAILFLIMIGRYTHPLLACLTVSAGLLFSLVFERLTVRTTWARLLVYVLMAVIGYAVMGAGGLAVFTLMTAVYSVFIRRQWSLTILVLLLGIACVASLAEVVYLLPRRKAFLIATPLTPEMNVGMKTLSQTLLFILYAFVPAAVTLLLVGRMVWNRKGAGRAPKAKGKKHSPVPKPRSASLSFGKRAVVTMLPLVLLAAGLIATYDRSIRDFVRINACTRRRQWSQLLDVARRLPKGKSHIACNHDINRALYHTGRLPYEMFSFPQNPHALLLTHQAQVSSLTELQLCELFTELGNVNTAEKMASELVAEQGNVGIALENLALISIVKGQPETARVYLNVLKHDLVHRHRADTLLAGLDGRFAPDVAARIERIRSCMTTDLYGITYGGSVEDILTGLLEQNPHNKMAFEYLMACYLLTRQLDKVIANLDRLDDFGYDGVPTYYEEAMLIYRTMRRQPIDPAQLGISPVTYQRYKSFVEVSRSMQASNQQVVMSRLIREFGSSYFFYYGFGRVGVARETASPDGRADLAPRPAWTSSKPLVLDHDAIYSLALSQRLGRVPMAHKRSARPPAAPHSGSRPSH